MTEVERLAERLLDLVSNFTKESYRETLTNSAALLRAQAEELERLRGALAKATEPTWFYHPDNTEICQFGIWDVIDYYDLMPGKHVCEVECARSLPSVWCTVHVLTGEEKDAMETDESWLVTEHATEQAARAALEETKAAPEQEQGSG